MQVPTKPFAQVQDYGLEQMWLPDILIHGQVTQADLQAPTELRIFIQRLPERIT